MMQPLVKSTNFNEANLEIEPIIKLKPSLKNFLWGGKQLKEKYNIQTTLDTVAEAWVLSAHPDGESIVFSGKYKGYPFSRYLEECEKKIWDRKILKIF